MGMLTRLRVRLASKLLPLLRAEIWRIGQVGLELPTVYLDRVAIATIAAPVVSDDLCVAHPELHQFTAVLAAPKREDLDAHFCEVLAYPEILEIDIRLGRPMCDGKAYREDAEGGKAALRAGQPERNCRHGIRESWCAICRRQEEERKRAAATVIDLFDLVFPILQPPLGDDFDNPIAFLPSQQLYGFQREGVKFLVENDRALLADEMGLGKSIQTIVALRILFRTGKVRNCLVVCPKSVLTDWERKFWDWAPELNRLVRVSGPAGHREVLWKTEAYVYLVTYETLREDLSCTVRKGDNAEDVARRQFDAVVLDEIQKIKNPSAQITQAARTIDAKIRWGLSGTPMENRTDELVSVFDVLKPGLLHYGDPVYKIKNEIKRYMRRRRKKEALPDLPEKVYHEVWLELSASQRAAYERAKEEGVVELNKKGDALTVTHVLQLINKLKQICNLDPREEESCKLEYLKDELDKMSEQEEKAIVFSQYPEKTLARIESDLRDFGPMRYHGQLSQNERDRVVQDFRNDGSKKVLLMSVQAGGTGLTLVEANNVFHYDLWWNPAVAVQAEDRTHRIGQRKTVFVNYLRTVDTIEERIRNLLAAKRQLFDEVIDELSDTDLRTSLSEEELYALLDLKHPNRKGKGVDRNKEPAAFFDSMSPTEFERLAADLYEAMGYHVRLTSASKDGGIDLYAKRVTDTGQTLLAVQCKHYPARKVGVQTARELYGVMQTQPDITQGVIVTSGQFSTECRDFSKGKRIELVDSSRFAGLCMKHGVAAGKRQKTETDDRNRS